MFAASRFFRLQSASEFAYYLYKIPKSGTNLHSQVHPKEEEELLLSGERERERDMDELSVFRRFPAPGRNPAGQALGMEFCGGGASLADMMFGFFEEGEESPESESSEEADTEGDGEDSDSVAQRKIFWEAQHQLLKGTLYRTSSLETQIRQDSEEALRESRSVGTNCVCQKPVSGGCRNCLLTDVTERLRNAGHDAAVCKSKWRSSPGIPSGEHRYLEVMGPARSGKSQVRVVIEVEFRAEFEMARASPEYKKLINHLPAVFVGKAERLKNLIKILSGAAKKCMKETHMHLPPWRKNKYMQAKWVATSERIVPAREFSTVLPDQRSKRRASMLTFDLSDTLPSLHHCSAVAVV